MQNFDLPAQNVEGSPAADIREAALVSGPLECSMPALRTTGSKRYRVAAMLFAGLVFAGSSVYVVITFQWGPIWSALREVNPFYLVGYGGSSIILYWMIRALRWHLLLKRTDTKVSFFDVYMCTAVALSFSIFTPLQSGEVVKVELLKKYGMIQRYPGYGSFLVERALDLATVLSIAGISLLTALKFVLPDRSYAYFLIGASISFSVIGICILYRLRFTGRAKQLLDQMRLCIRSFPQLLLVTFITFVSWSSVTLSWYLLLHCGSLSLDFFRTAALMSTVTLISILSLVPGGLGVSEAGTSQVLVWLGFAPAAAQTGTLLLRSYSVIAIALGIVHLVLWKMVRRNRGCSSGAASFATMPPRADTAGVD